MKIIILEDFYQTVKNRHILLDTNIFVDASINPRRFSEFFNSLKDNDTTVVTLDVVRIEFLQGASDQLKYKAKQTLIDKIVDAVIPIDNRTFEHCYTLIQEYKEKGKSLSATDFLLGATTMRYANHLFLLTKNTNEFPSNIFTVNSVLNLIHQNGIQSYGLYSFSS